MKISIVILKFLFIGALFIVSNEVLYLSQGEDLSQFFGLFYNWLANLFGHGADITGYVLNSEWLPGSNASDVFG